MAVIAVSTDAKAVIMSTTRSGSVRFSSSRTSRPPISGSMTSTIAASKPPLRARARPWGPPSATDTEKPASVRRRESTSRITSSSSTTRIVSWLISPLRGFGQGEGGQRHLHARALAGPDVHEDRPPVLLHDAVGDGEAETGPASDALGREEGVVDPLHVLAADPVAGVLHLDDHGVVVRARPEREPAAPRH